MKHFTKSSVFALAWAIAIAWVGLNITVAGLTGGQLRTEKLWSWPLVASDHQLDCASGLIGAPGAVTHCGAFSRR
jgi:hypothetical protein